MIKNIKIKNFKSLQNLTIACENLNLLTGINGVGKSSFIQSLLILRQSYQKEYFDTKNKKIALQGAYVDVGNFADAMFDEYDKKENFIQFEIIFDKIVANWQTNIDYTDNKENNDLSISTKNVDEKIFSEALFANKKFQYINTERFVPKDRIDGNMNKVNDKDFGIDGRFALQYFIENATKNINIKELAHQNEKQILTLETQVNAWLNEISPNVKVEAKYTDAKKSYIEPLFSYGIKGGKYKAKNIGFGISYVFSVILALLTAEKGDLLVIENPESHLHPRGQSKLAELMCLAAQNGVQIFCETHSDHIFYGMRIAIKENKIEHQKVNVCYFDKIKSATDTKIHTIKINKNGRMTNDIPDGFFDQYEINLDKLL